MLRSLVGSEMCIRDRLEGEYLERGPKAKFNTTDFSFNKAHGTKYQVNFSKMLQTNKQSSKSRSMRRGDGTSVTPTPAKKGAKKNSKNAVAWQWWEKEEMTWQHFADEDAGLLEAAYKSGSPIFVTKNLSFNKGYDSEYIFDFIVMAQMNNESGTSRKIARKGSGAAGEADSDDDDDGYGSALTAIYSSKAKASGDKFCVDISSKVSASLASKQKKVGAQSLRGGMKKDYGPAVSKDKHGSKCFDRILELEADFSGEWAVFYHSYSVAALLYEVQAAVAAVLFRFKSEFASLPRLLWGPFEHIPTAARMLEEFPKWKDRDHNKAFRGVGLCGVSSLLAHDSEAPPKSVFLMGYSVGPLTGLLERLLQACGVPASQVTKLTKQIVDIAGNHGLDCKAFGGKSCKSGRSGHYLQMFIRRDLVDKYVYPAFPFGVPDKSRMKPSLSKYLEQDTQITGQIRITANPDIFLRATCVRMFVYSADPSYHAKRPEFMKLSLIHI
eukprot:TRINITY_DN61474_c0_g1_i1.p1 TRINITY_DN61474_c0_g1~~TRINITY_DN61474_c0_g1_i1.p1  ORF type:complete len:497 (+),score=126.85 TRINITY_DN61474_c0_g1_i1:144-1634(+)